MTPPRTAVEAASQVEAFLGRWKVVAKGWYRELFGPGLLGEFTRLRVILRSGAALGTIAGVLIASTSGGPWVVVPLLLLVGPVVAGVVVAMGIGVLALGDAANRTWIRSPERRARSLAVRVDELGRHLETSPLSIANVTDRDALVAELHDAIVYEEVRRRATPGNGGPLSELSRRMARLSVEEHDRVMRYTDDPNAMVEAARIVDVPAGPPVVRVFERRGAARAADTYAIALSVLLRKYVIGRAASGDLIVLVEAPAGFAACLALDGWTPRGEAVGPVDDEERETIVALWDGGLSPVYTDAVELLEAARRL